MGFGYKTAWIAVSGGTTLEVADALSLGRRRPMSFAQGTEMAYSNGVYVSAPVNDWTLAHGRELVDDAGPTGPDFLRWLATMSGRLGHVQYFHTHRVADCHQWADARDGTVLRAYAYQDGGVAMFVGDPTAAEIECGLGAALPSDSEAGGVSWEDEDTDGWPSEESVMRIASLWSVDPTTIDDRAITEDGLFGHLTWRRSASRRLPRLRPSRPS